MADSKSSGGKIKGNVLLSVILVILIIIIGFDLQPRGTTPVHQLSNNELGMALYICPANSSVFYSIAKGLTPMLKIKNIVIISLLLATILIWFYRLYISFLKDKFERETYNTPFAILIIFFITMIGSNLLFHSPNYYRYVWYIGTENEYVNYDTPYVLCESTNPKSIPVGYNAVSKTKIIKHQ